MKNDPVNIRMRELGWRRELSAAEQAELRSWLAAHPEAQADWEDEARLNKILQGLPNMPVPSNFTARVLEAVERESATTVNLHAPRAWWLRIFAPRLAMAAALVVGCGLVTIEYRRAQQRQKIVRSLSVISEVASIPNPADLQNFEAIRRVGPQPDKELLGLLQ